MQVKKCGSSYLIRLEIGEEVVASLGSFVRERKIRSGWLQGIGAIDQVTVGTYDIKHRRYVKKTFAGDQELLNMTGNIAWLGRDPVLHIHALIADQSHKVSGGHLFSGRTCVTVEVVVQPWTVRVTRAPDAGTGLNLLKLSGHRRRPVVST